MKKINVAISCIGSGVGQSVINSCRLSRLPLKTIGFGTNPFAYGAYDCDVYDYTPSIYSKDYIDKLIEKCLEHKIDILIPGVDNEVLIYARNEDKLKKAGIKAIFAAEEITSLCRDKEKMTIELNKYLDVFVKSIAKLTLERDIEDGKIEFPFIAKPRAGFASNNIRIIGSKDDLQFITEEHILQELAMPSENDPYYDFYISELAKKAIPQVSEISIQLVFGMKGEILGRMISMNRLNNGVPIEILPYENPIIWETVDKLIPILTKMGARGPLNLQGRLTDNGLKIFEINPRFTGITGLRALMGFNEVEACIKHWLNIEGGSHSLNINFNRFGVRQTADKSIALELNEKISNLSKQLNGEFFKTKKNLLVTGACGYLGQSFIQLFKEDIKYQIWPFDLDKEKTKSLYPDYECYNKEDLVSGALALGNVDILIHLGFARPHCTNEQVADSLKFTIELFTQAALNHVPAVINISSQSVYGLNNRPLWTENTPAAPETVYAQAKYATELILENLRKVNNQFKSTSIRLAALSGGQEGLIANDIVSKFVLSALSNSDIKIVGGSQQLERLDVRDAASALYKILNTNPTIWKPIYNLGYNKVYSIMDIANMAISEVKNKYPDTKSTVLVEESEINLKFGMESALFYKDFDWKPENHMVSIINSLVHYFAKKKV